MTFGDSRSFLSLRRSFRSALLAGTLVASAPLWSAYAEEPAMGSHEPHGPEPFTLERVIDIPRVPVGPYSDTMALDVARKRLFATPQAAKAVAVLDIEQGRLLQMISGIGNPHAIVYDPSVDRLFVADGASADVKVFDGKDYSQIGSIPLTPGTDMGAYDARRQIFYVMNGGEKAGMAHSIVSAIDTAKMRKIADIPVDTTNPQGLEIDIDNQLLYVSLPEKYAVAVIDLKAWKLRTTFKMPDGKRSPWISAIDHKRNRIYVACRDDFGGTDMRGSMVVMDATSGRAVATFPIGGWADSIFVDQKRDRIYVSTGVGHVETFGISGGDSYVRLPSVDTALMAKTSLYSSDFDRLFVTTPNLGTRDAGVRVLRPTP
jgi:DNA-binding beta-propeller fold protein YncE